MVIARTGLILLIVSQLLASQVAMVGHGASANSVRHCDGLATTPHLHFHRHSHQPTHPLPAVERVDARRSLSSSNPHDDEPAAGVLITTISSSAKAAGIDSRLFCLTASVFTPEALTLDAMKGANAAASESLSAPPCAQCAPILRI